MTRSHDEAEDDPHPALLEIAKSCFKVDTLKRRGRDDLDFKDVGVFSMRRAIEEAYKLGWIDAQQERPYKLK
jgi:hypothetical protein